MSAESVPPFGSEMIGAMAALHPDTRDLLLHILEFQHARDLSMLEFSGHLRDVMKFCDEMIAETKKGRFDKPES